MKKIIYTLTFLLISLNLFSQVPEINGYPFYAIDVVQNSATIVWKTKESTLGVIYYTLEENGKEQAIKEESDFGTSHIVTITNLKPCGFYNYYIIATTKDGEEFISSTKEFFKTGGCEGRYKEMPSDIEKAHMLNLGENIYVLEWSESKSEKLEGYLIWGFDKEGKFTVIDKVSPETFNYKFELNDGDYEKRFWLDNYEFYIQPFDAYGNFGHAKLALFENPDPQEAPLTITCTVARYIRCHGGNDGAVLISAFGGKPPYKNIGLIENLGVGNHTFEVFDGEGNSKDCAIELFEPNELSINCSVSKNITKYNANDGAVMVQATGGIQPYIGTGSQINLSAGKKIFSVADYNACVSSCEITLTQPEECPKLSTTPINFSSTINPTGNPIGGGKCYSNVISQSQAKYVSTTKDSLLKHLSLAKSGDIIYIPENVTIDLTGLKNIVIPGGVTIASNRGKDDSNGGLIKYNSFWPEAQYTAMFVTGGENVRITGLRLQGPNPEIWDHDYSRLYANAIRTLHKKIEVDNVEAWAWDKWFLWLNICDGAYVHHNYIHHTQRAGYGYPVWVGGSGSETNGNVKIYANIFEAARHCIASSGHRNSWEGKYNVVLNQQLYVNFDRHMSGSSNIGGKNTTLSNNLILSKQDRNVGFAFPDTTVGGKVLISDNYFKNPSNNSGGCGNVYNLKDTIFYGNNVQFKNNKFGLAGAKLPQAIINVDKVEGIAPLTINFDGKESYDTDSNEIVEYIWRFADGDYRGNEIRSNKGSYTFKDPGMYTITLFVKNSYGIPSEISQKTIKVNPAEGTYVLSCWIKDSYPYDKSDRYIKQVLVDNEVVWSDDVTLEEGWQHIVIDIGRFGASKSQHRIAFRLCSKNGVSTVGDDISEMFMWVDDVWVFGSTETLENSNYSLENLKIYPPFNQAFYYLPGYKSGTSTANTTEDYRGGEKSFRLRFVQGGTYPPGQWGELYKYVIFK